jgi:RNA polymerase sigma factor (sigma-70 family)
MDAGETSRDGTARPPSLRFRREAELRSPASRGDAAAFARVYERHHQSLYRYCRSLLRHDEDAQDALQNTMVSAFSALQGERRDFELRPWLFRIAHNEAMTILSRRRVTSELDETARMSASLEEQVEDREDLRALHADLAELPDRQRDALLLREFNGLSQHEIGQVLGCSTAAVQQSIFEARTTLLKCRDGRDMRCEAVRSAIANGDGRTLRASHIRAHLRTCSACRRFRADLASRPGGLAALVPPLPASVAPELLRRLLPGTAGADWGAMATGAGLSGALVTKARPRA